jgi:hypothetical protein
MDTAPALQGARGTVVTQEIGIERLQEQCGLEASDGTVGPGTRIGAWLRIETGSLGPQGECAKRAQGATSGRLHRHCYRKYRN